MNPNPSPSPDMVIIGRIGKTHGVHGALNVHSFCEPVNNICLFSEWTLSNQRSTTAIKVLSCRPHKKGFIAKLEGINSPEDAQQWVNFEISVHASKLPALVDNQFYRRDLIGLAVTNQTQQNLGNITEVIETGANDVFVVEGATRELIPYIDSVVIDIDMKNKVVFVNWDAGSQT